MQKGREVNYEHILHSISYINSYKNLRPTKQIFDQLYCPPKTVISKGNNTISYGDFNASSNDLNNLNIGSRNYLRNTAWTTDLLNNLEHTLSSNSSIAYKANQWYKEDVTLSQSNKYITITNSSTKRLGFIQFVPFESGQDYILSVGSSGAFNIALGYYDVLPVQLNWSEIQNLDNSKFKTSMGRYYYKISNVTANYIAVYVYSTSESTSTINYLKLEKGNQPTDWSPAPEDSNLDGVKDLINQQTQDLRSISTHVMMWMNNLEDYQIKPTANVDSTRLIWVAALINGSPSPFTVSNIQCVGGSASIQLYQGNITVLQFIADSTSGPKSIQVTVTGSTNVAQSIIEWTGQSLITWEDPQGVVTATISNANGTSSSSHATYPSDAGTMTVTE